MSHSKVSDFFRLVQNFDGLLDKKISTHFFTQQSIGSPTGEASSVWRIAFDDLQNLLIRFGLRSQRAYSGRNILKKNGNGSHKI